MAIESQTDISTTVHSPLGRLTLSARDGLLVAVRFRRGAGKEAPGLPGADLDDPLLAAAATQLEEYFAGDRREFDLPLAQVEAGFDRRVLDAVAGIPYGERRSYGEITGSIGLPMERARDVGAAVGRNPLPIIVPCHRVVGADGSLVGYGGGLSRKAKLLELEAPQLQLSA